MIDHKGIGLYDHNQEAYDKLCILLRKHRKACIIHPTGTGKSFIAFKYIEEHPNDKILWLAPSKQIFAVQISNLMQAAGVKSTVRIREKIHFWTYAGIIKVPPKTFSGFDVIVLDEFHRCGADEWSKSIKKIIRRNSKAMLIGLSATHIRYLDDQRNMAEEIFSSNIASQMTLAKAFNCGILRPPKYVIVWSGSDEEAIERIKRSTGEQTNLTKKQYIRRNLKNLRHNIGRSYGLNAIIKKYVKKGSRFIIFCRDNKHIDEIIPLIPEWFEGVDNEPVVYRLTSRNDTVSVIRLFQNDRSEHVKLLICIDKLNEGLHIPGIDGIIMLRATESPIIYLQQIGRVLCASNKGTPIVIDVVNNYRATLHTIDTCYRSKGKEGHRIRKSEAGHAESDDIDFYYMFEVEDVAKDGRELLLRLGDLLQSSWETYFILAKKYYEENGNLRISRNYVSSDGLLLGRWLRNQRLMKHGLIKGKLPAEKEKMLESIGIDWEAGIIPKILKGEVYKTFDDAYRYLKWYKSAYGDLYVPYCYIVGNFNLGEWVRLARKRYRGKNLKIKTVAEQRRLLNAIGFIWDPDLYEWNRYYKWLTGYHRIYGNIDLPRNTYIMEGYGDIYEWVERQKKNKEIGKLSDYKIIQLNNLDINWSSQEWEWGYKRAKYFYEKYGTLDLNQCYVRDESFDLLSWLRKQREDRTKLSNDQIGRLDDIGMVWKSAPVPNTFAEKNLNAVREYFEEHGNIDIPLTYRTESGIMLGHWIRHQKELKRRLSKNRIAILEKYGINWEIED